MQTTKTHKWLTVLIIDVIVTGLLLLSGLNKNRLSLATETEIEIVTQSTTSQLSLPQTVTLNIPLDYFPNPEAYMNGNTPFIVRFGLDGSLYY